MDEKVLVEIDPKAGTIRYEVQGMEGTGCEDLTNALTAGMTVQETGYTHEYRNEEGVPAFTNN